MGLGIFSSSCFDPASIKSTVPGNPNPFNYQIIKTKQIKNFAILMIKYPECKNYEGNKILVFKDISIEDLRQRISIDPHFCEDKQNSPIARFVPTDEGWFLAIQLALSGSPEKSWPTEETGNF